MARDEKRRDPGEFYPGGKVWVRPGQSQPQGRVTWDQIEGKPHIEPLPDRYKESDMKGKINEIASKFATALAVALVGWTALAGLVVQKAPKDQVWNDEEIVTNAYLTGENASGAVRTLPKYLWIADFDDSYKADAEWYYAQRQDFGGCSAVRDGGFLYRNYDWKFDEAAEFVVRMAAGNGRFASVGVANAGTNLTEEIIASGAPNRYVKALPGHTVDGINEKGVVCNVNVVDGPVTGCGGGDIHPLGAVRWVLDNATSALDAATNLAARICFPQGLSQNFHWMVSDADKTYIVENGGYHEVTGRAVMTNFKLYPQTQGSGWERYNLLTSPTASITNAWYTKAYLRSTNWISEFRDAAEMEEAKVAWETHTREQLRGHGLWQTVHTSVYDIEQRILRIAVQEQDDWYVVKLPAQGGKSVEIDPTLSQEGKAADALATGQAIQNAGKVKKVANVEPNADGNVPLTASSIGAPMMTDVYTKTDIDAKLTGKRDKTDLTVYSATITGFTGHEISEVVPELLEAFRSATPTYAPAVGIWGLINFSSDNWSAELVPGQPEDADIVRYVFVDDWDEEHRVNASVRPVRSIAPDDDSLSTRKTSVPFETISRRCALDPEKVVLKNGTGTVRIASILDVPDVLKQSEVSLSTPDGMAADAKDMKSQLSQKADKSEIPTVYEWAKRPTKPTYTPAEVGAFPAASGQTLQEAVNVISVHLNAEDAKDVITNYDSTVNMPSRRLEYKIPDGPDAGTWRVVWDELTRWNWLIDEYLPTNYYTKAEVDARTDNIQWGLFDSQTGNFSPDKTVQISSDRVILCKGASYQRTVTAQGSYWVWTSNEPYSITGVESNGYFRIEDAEGNTTFEIVKGDKVTAAATAGGLTTEEVMGITHLHISYPIEADTHPTLEICNDLKTHDWKAETDGSCLANVTWTGVSGNYSAEVWGKGVEDALFVKATYQRGSDPYVRYAQAIQLQTVKIGNTIYYVGTASISGHTVLTLSLTPPSP